MIETDFQYYCQDCSRIAPEAKISKLYSDDEDEPIVTTVKLFCSHQKECARLMRELEAKYTQSKQNQLNKELIKRLENPNTNGTERNRER